MSSYTDKNLYERVIARQGDMESIRAPWEQDCDSIIDMFRPDMVKFSEKSETRNKILGSKIFEGTGPWAAGLMSDGIRGNLVSSSIEWLRYSMEELFLKGNDEVNKWLQDFEEHMLSVYREPSSNYYAELGSFCRGGITVGSPVLIPELDERSGKIMCMVPHSATRYLMQNRFGVTDILHLKDEWTIRNAVDTFGKENFSDGVQHLYEEGNDTGKVSIIRGIYFYLDRIFKDLPAEKIEVTEGSDYSTEKPLVTKTSSFRPRWPWVSIYVEENSQGDEKGYKKPLRIEGYWSKPFSVWHYEKDQREVYARTPAWYSYYDTKSANAMSKSLLMAGQKSVETAWWAPSFLRTKFKTYPRGINWFDRSTMDMEPKSLDQKIDYPFGFEVKEAFTKSVDRWFHVRMWMMLSIWSEEKKAPPTATQIIQMAGEKAVLLGPRVGRFTNALEEIDNRFVDIEQRRGNLPEPPDIVLEMSEGKVRPEFVGPLAQLQKQFHSTRRIEAGLAAAAPIFDIDPMVRHKIDAAKLLEYVLEENKFPQDVIRDDDEYEDIVAAIAQQKMLEEGVQMGTEVAKAVPSVSKDVEPNSPLALMEGAA